MLKKSEIAAGARLVDDWRKPCPGTIDEKQLKRVGIQRERRFLFFRSVKHIIYLQEGTHNLWYKNKHCGQGAAVMGFSLKRLGMHPSAVPMEFYYQVFTTPDKPLPVELLRGQSLDTLREIAMPTRKWLEINNFELEG